MGDLDIYNNINLVCMENSWTTLNSQFYAKTVGARKRMSEGKVHSQISFNNILP